MAHERTTPGRPSGSGRPGDDLIYGEEASGAENISGVTDSYVARRVAEHRAVIEDAGRRDAEEQVAAAAGQGHFGFYILLGIVMSCLLLVVIYAGTRELPEPTAFVRVESAERRPASRGVGSVIVPPYGIPTPQVPSSAPPSSPSLAPVAPPLGRPLPTSPGLATPPVGPPSAIAPAARPATDAAFPPPGLPGPATGHPTPGDAPPAAGSPPPGPAPRYPARPEALVVTPGRAPARPDSIGAGGAPAPSAGEIAPGGVR